MFCNLVGFSYIIFNFVTRAPSNLWGRNPVEWTPLKAGQRQEYLQLDEYPRMTVTDERFENSWKFWDDLPLKEYGKI